MCAARSTLSAKGDATARIVGSQMGSRTCTTVQNATSGVRHSAISRGSNVESRRQSVPNSKGQIDLKTVAKNAMNNQSHVSARNYRI